MTTRRAVGLSFGSNIGDKIAMVRSAVRLLEDSGTVSGLLLSSFYRTAPWGHVVAQDWFVNACGVGTTELQPAALLAAVKTIERRLGRIETVRWGPRIIDIDILYYDDLRLETPGLTLPHRDILNRAFVLVPLAEIAPDRRIGGVTVSAAAAAVGTQGIERLALETDENAGYA